MALFNLSVFLALACVTAFCEPTLRQGNNDTVLLVVDLETNVWCGKSEQHLEKKSTSNSNIIVKQVSGPPPKDDAASQVYEAVNERVASMQVIPQTANAQLQSGGDAPSTQVSATIDLTIGQGPKTREYRILYYKSSNSTKAAQQ